MTWPPGPVCRDFWRMVGATPIGGLPKLIFAEAENFPEIARFYHDQVIARGVALTRGVVARGIARDSLGFLLADVSRLMRRAFDARLKSRSLTLSQARALVYVSRQEGLRQVELAQLLGVQPITLARLVDQLCAGGLVERRADPVDRRAYQLFLRPAAGPLLAEIGRVAASVRMSALRGLNERAAAAVLAGLRHMRGNLS